MLTARLKFPVSSNWLIEKLSLNKALMRVGKSIACPCRDQMPGTEKEEGSGSFFCFVVLAEAGSARACLKQPECKFLGNCRLSPLHRGTLVLRLCPSGGLFPINDFIQKFHSLPRHHNHLTENDTPFICAPRPSGDFRY